MRSLKHLTIEVDFMRQGSLVFTGTTFVGFVGILTGMRPGKHRTRVNPKPSVMHLYSLPSLSTP